MIRERGQGHEAREEGIGDANEGNDVDVEDPSPVVELVVDEAAGQVHPGVVDQRVDRAAGQRRR